MNEQPLTVEQRDEIDTRAAYLHEYGTLTDGPLQADLDQVVGTDVPALLAEVGRLIAALDQMRAARDVIASMHRDVEAQRDQARRIAVALEQETARLEDELAETKALNDPRLRGLLVKTAPDKDQYVLWSTVCDMPGGVFSRETALEYGFPRSKVDWADEHGTSSRRGDGAWDDKGWVAEQRGWLPRHLIGDYAIEYLHGDRIAAYALLEPFDDDGEAQQP